MTRSAPLRIVVCVLAVCTSATLPARQMPAMDSIGRNHVDMAHAERVVLIAEDGRETALSGPPGFIDAVEPCATKRYVPVTRWIVETHTGSTDEIRYRTTDDMVSAFGRCVSGRRI